MFASMAACFHCIIVLAIIVSIVDGRGRSRGRSRGRKRGRSRMDWGSRRDEDAEPTKPEDAMERCTSRSPLPPVRIGGFASSAHADHPETWTYLRLLPESNTGAKFEKVEWTVQRQSSCEQIFVGGKPPTRAMHPESNLACLLAPVGATEEKALFASDYNKERGLPNFVAFTMRASSNKASTSNVDDLQDVSLALPLLDSAYSPGPPERCCWCSDSDREQDEICAQKVGRAGHLAPPHAFNDSHTIAGRVFLNTVPMRLSFAEQQWAQRLQDLYRKAVDMQDRFPNRQMHVVVGPSLQADGRLSASSSTDGRFIEVPSFLWTAYADPHARAAGAYICRNGGVDDECGCVDKLRIKDVEERVGFRFFPGLSSASDPSYLHLPSTRRSGYSYLFCGVCAFVVVTLVVFLIVCCLEESDNKKKDYEESSPKRSLREKLEESSREKKKRQTLESAVGGKEALRSRFRAV